MNNDSASRGGYKRMSFKEVQKRVDDWASQYKIKYWQPHEIITRLTEENGEVAREINHLYGPKKKKPEEKEGDLGVEIADVIFTLCCLANSEGIDLDESFEKVMDKCYGRDNDRYEKK
jgi:NTP pyrophosphatase (non-canonical NTP hydrolase)